MPWVMFPPNTKFSYLGKTRRRKNWRESQSGVHGSDNISGSLKEQLGLRGLSASANFRKGDFTTEKRKVFHSK